jgi:hypothetical protein
MLQLVFMFVIIVSLIMMLLQSTCMIDSGLQYFYLLFPGYALGNAFVKLGFLKVLPSLYSLCADRPVSVCFRLVLRQLWRASHHLLCAFQTSGWEPMSMKVCGINVLYMGVSAVCYFVMAILIDFSLSSPWIRRFFMTSCARLTTHAESTPIVDEDDDVAAERADILNGKVEADDVFVLKVRCQSLWSCRKEVRVQVAAV